MGFNISNFLNSKSKNHKMIDFQDLDHIDGLSISAVVQIFTKPQEMIWSCFISEKEQILHQFILNLK